MGNDADRPQLTQEEYRCHPSIRFRIGNSGELQYLTLKREGRLLSLLQAGLLDACSGFASLETHAEHIAKRVAPGSVDFARIVEGLRLLAADGLMLSSTELRSRMATLPKPEPPPKISWLAIPTCNRPEHLMHTIRSFGANFRKHGRFPRLLVADDSKTPQARASTKAVIAEGAKDWSADVVYTGPEQKRSLIDCLVKESGLPRSVLEFGISGPGGPSQGAGANRNTIMLQTLGDMVLSVDDDTVCSPCATPGPRDPAFRFAAHRDPFEYRFFPDRQLAMDFVCPAEVDVLAAHESMLGRPVHTLGETLGEICGPDLSSACVHVIQSSWDGRGKVLITSNGCVGDSGPYSDHDFPCHPGPETMKRLLASEEQYRLALQSCATLRQVPSTTVSHGVGFISMFFGVDNRATLPPFFPVGHGEDGIFASISDRYLDECFFGHLPWALIHNPEAGRLYSGRSATTVRISQIVVSCVSTWSYLRGETTADDRLRSLGEHLEAIASLPTAEFDEHIRLLMWQMAARRVSAKKALLREYHEQPAFWAADLRQENEDTLMALADANYCAPVDILDCTDRLRQAQSLLLNYSRLLRWWPALRARVKGHEIVPLNSH